jgi:hypothetical protein
LNSIPSRSVALSRRLYNRFSRGRVSEAAVSGCGFPVMTRLGHGLQVVPVVEQDRVAVVRYPVIDNGRRPATAGAVILFALAERIAREEREPEPLPAAAIDPRG